MNIIQVNNIFNDKKIQELQDDLAIATELAILIVDYKGNPITSHSQCSEFCQKARKNPELNQKCEKCDSRGGIEAVRTQDTYIYKCHFGLVDLAVPIIVNNQYLGALMAGQVRLVEKESEVLEWIVSRKSQTNIDAYPYLRKAYNKIPELKIERVKAIARLLHKGIQYIISESLNQLGDYSSVEDVKAYYAKEHVPLSNMLQPAYDHIDLHYASKLLVSDMARLCNISESYFSKLFNKENNMGFNAYMNEYRLTKSRALMEDESKTIIQIALELGYEDCSYFIRLFKKKYGVTPSVYRKNISWNTKG